jgi:hypothetical protein
MFVTDVPAEFRRTEFFIGGTIPNKSMLNLDENSPPEDPTGQAPSPSATPLTETWQENLDESGRPKPGSRTSEPRGFVNVMICPVTMMRATVNCPRSDPKSFRIGSEPKDFCPIHSSP